MQKDFDIVVFGATGYTGMIVCEELARYSRKNSNIAWAVAGRSDSNLQKTLHQISERTGLPPVKQISRIVATVENPESLLAMAERAKVVINCVGPFSVNGEEVVKACLKGGAHSLDISCENQYLESVQLRYDAEARKKGLFVIGSLGFDSVPTEVGIQYTVEKFPGALNEVEAFIYTPPMPSKSTLSMFETMTAELSNAKNLGELRKRLFPRGLPKPPSLQKPRSRLFYEDAVSSWCIPYVGSNEGVVFRSQRRLYESNRIDQAIQFRCYRCVPNYLLGLFLLIYGFIIGVLLEFAVTRKLLLRKYKLFSAGMVSKEGSPRDHLETTSFTTTFLGLGYEKSERAKTGEPTKFIITRLRGPDPYFITTAICVVQAAIILLSNADRMPDKSGVFSPGAAFWNTDYIQRLRDRGLTFEVVSNEGGDTEQRQDKDKET
ncbi:unnamed protein product [Mesocestoides corti]|uniref:Sacchrp_dh_NADP domain-containing protein n=3 Tax=Mesocestoides corti TaxID=53468 RepID=A0A0R3U5R5_MESCO|nr:unnamed protein product [Mesocestoides corti]